MLLALDPAQVAIDTTAIAGIVQRSFAVHALNAGAELWQYPIEAVYGDALGVAEALRDRDVDAAKRVHDLDEGGEVDGDLVIDPNLREVVLNGGLGRTGRTAGIAGCEATVAVGGVDTVLEHTAAAVGDLDPQIARDAQHAAGARGGVERQHKHRV